MKLSYDRRKYCCVSVKHLLVLPAKVKRFTLLFGVQTRVSAQGPQANKAFKHRLVTGEPGIEKGGCQGRLNDRLLTNRTSVFHLFLAVGNTETWFLLNPRFH